MSTLPSFLDHITGMTADSRAVKDGYLFAALKGAVHDGYDFIPAAIQAGARVILTDRPYKGEAGKGVSDNVQIWQSDDPRGDFARACAAFYGGRGAQPDVLVAVTGTNGKSSVVSFCEQIWQALGYNGASLGTINSKLTSLDPVSLHEALRDLKAQGITHLALEASSHGLDQRRMDGLRFNVAGFTNLSRDHLDYHANMDEYFTAKARLFTDLLEKRGVAVINADVLYGRDLIAKAPQKGWSYGVQGAQVKLLSLRPQAGGAQVKLDVFGQIYDVLIPLIGAFQIDNLLCALGLVIGAQTDAQTSAGQSPDSAFVGRALEAIKTIKPVRGRLECVDGHPQGAQIYIDYAHTPDALKTVLQAVRPHVKGQLFCLFGCGGDRDKGKRPLMGEAGANHADVLIITDDNPRSEKAVDIRKEILASANRLMHNENVFEIEDRAAAIDFSIQKLKQDDVLIIAGKGHETVQILSDKTIPFDDAQCAREAILRL